MFIGHQMAFFSLRQKLVLPPEWRGKGVDEINCWRKSPKLMSDSCSVTYVFGVILEWPSAFHLDGQSHALGILDCCLLMLAVVDIKLAKTATSEGLWAGHLTLERGLWRGRLSVAWPISFISLTKVIAPQQGVGSIRTQPLGGARKHRMGFIALSALHTQSPAQWDYFTANTSVQGSAKGID